MQPIPGRYNTIGPWLKGQTHVHTTFSDGGKDYGTVTGLYADAGYDFVFITDHGRVADVEAMPDPPLLALNGIEIDGADETGQWYHACGLGYSDELDSALPFADRVARLQEAGAIVVLAHPYWTGNSVEDALRHPFDGVEVYNDICNFLNGKSHGAYHWDRMLERAPRTLGFAVDDAHLNGNETPDHAWIMVAARSRTKDDILAAIRAGSFYATQGPQFRSIEVEERRVRVTTSPVRMIRLVAGAEPYAGWGDRRWSGDRDGRLLTEADFLTGPDHDYLRVEIEDENGHLAWTNAVLENER